MPSVEMRRTTRVFVPKAKDDDGLVRVLRSGRRLWVESSEGKSKGGKNGDDFYYPMVENGNGNGNGISKSKNSSFIVSSLPHQQKSEIKSGESWWVVKEVEKKKNQECDLMEIDGGRKGEEVVRERSGEVKVKEKGDDRKRMFGIVYTRKRKRVSLRGENGSGSVKEDRKFGLHFVRRKRTKTMKVCSISSSSVNLDREDDQESLMISVESSCAGCGVFSSLLSSVIRCMIREEIDIRDLSEFFRSEAICSAFLLRGVRFSWGHSCMKNRGLGRIFGAKQLIPLFTLDFSAAPLCFLHLHATMLLRSVHSLSYWSTIDDSSEDEGNDIEETLSLANDHSTIDESLSFVNDQSKLNESLSYITDLCKVDGSFSYITDQSNYSPAISLITDTEEPKGKKPATPSRVGKLSSRNVPQRSGVITRSASKRRRRSLRTRRARNPSPFLVQKTNFISGSDHVVTKKNALSLSLLPNQQLRRSARKKSSDDLTVPKSSPLAVTVDADSSCFGNLLVVESEKCYRVEGVEIVLDVSTSNEWVLAVRKDGSTKHCLRVQREMRPFATNHYSHAPMWSLENGWKLEFPERKDWSVFKDIYKLCGQRNVTPSSPVVKNIPIPVVREVANDWVGTIAFERPDSYIKMSSDELSRVLTRRTANYDLDYEDEEWLNNLNSELDAADFVSVWTFELMIDALEKASFFSPDNCYDERAVISLCSDLASSQVAVEVYKYWLRKRKQRHGPLLKVFQLNASKRAHLANKPVLRKKRSLKRQCVQSMQRGRGKDCSVLHAIAAEQTAAVEQSAFLQVEEAKASASRSIQVAIFKRQRAQLLMENADLAMYRATMALRIADAAQVADAGMAAAFFLDY